MIEKSSDQNTKHESQDTHVVETIANKVLVHMQQKLQTQEGGAHVSGQ